MDYKPTDAVLLREKFFLSWLINMADTIKRIGWDEATSSVDDGKVDVGSARLSL